MCASGFATAVSVEPDVLLIDEVLAVGDQSFQTKCLARIAEMHDRGVTIVFVSHDLDTVASLCSRAIWFDSGQLAADGPAEATIDLYLTALEERNLLRTSSGATVAALGPAPTAHPGSAWADQSIATGHVAYRPVGSKAALGAAFLNAENQPTHAADTRTLHTGHRL